tara:strand:- start:826 stop:1143 length:318 start_codon:yes stop_codon:yes gene_type:complete
MSTSNIPIYYDNHLVGSITLAEFMSQPRYDGHSVATLMSLSKNDLLRIRYDTASDAEKMYCPKFSGRTKKDLLWTILLHYYTEHGEIQWEREALREIQRVYLNGV